MALDEALASGETGLMNRPVVFEIKSGWLAKGRGWAVRGATREAALQAYAEAEAWHREVDARPPPEQATTPTSELVRVS